MTEAGAPDGDEEVLAACADRLATGVEAGLPGWVESCVARLVLAWTGSPPDSEVAQAAAAAGRQAALDVGGRVRELLALDVEEQWTNPLAIVRQAVAYPTDVLREAGVSPVERDEIAVEQFPDDVYDLTPTRFDDLDTGEPKLGLHETGLRWGAAKAFVVKARHRPSSS